MNIHIKTFLTLAMAAVLTGCASFTSGDIKIDKEIAVDMLQSKDKHPYSELRITWENFPYRTGADAIGTGVIDYETGKFKKEEIKPETVEPKLQQKISEIGKKVFKKAGLLDRNTGKGILELKMQTVNRWTYGELMNKYLVETPFILIFPNSLPTSYVLETEIETSTGTKNISLSAVNKTMFFLPFAIIYPLLPPGNAEKSILNQIMWRMATEIYEAKRKADKELADNPGLAERLAREKLEKEEAAKKAKLAEQEAQLKKEDPTTENQQNGQDTATEDEEFMPTMTMSGDDSEPEGEEKSN